MEKLRHLKNPQRAHDLALKLEHLPQEGRAWNLFTNLLKELNADKTPRGIHQTQVVHHFTSFLEPEEVYRYVRPVCKSWKESVDSAPRRNVEVIFAQHNQEPDGFFRMFERITIDMGHGPHMKEFEKKALATFVNMKSIQICYIPQPNNSISGFLHILFQNSRKTLRHISIPVLNLPFKLPNLRTAEFEIHPSDSLEMVQQAISNLDLITMEKLMFLSFERDELDFKILEFWGSHPNCICANSPSLDFGRFQFIALEEPNLKRENDAYVEYIKCDPYETILFPELFGENQEILEQFPALKGVFLPAYEGEDLEIESVRKALENTHVRVLEDAAEYDKLFENYLGENCRIELLVI